MPFLIRESGYSWIAVGITCLVVCGCQPHKTTKSASSKTTESLIELAPSDIVAVRSGDIGQMLSANGTLRAIQQSVIRAKVAGEIVAVNAREGEHVQAEQVLARIDDSEYVAHVKDRRASLEAGRAQATFAESTRSKNEELLQKKFISSQAYDNAKSAAAVAAAQVQSLEAQLTLAEKSLNDTVVRAPISGWIAERSIQRGDKTSVDGNLFSIVDLSRLELEALIPANEVARVSPGQVFSTKIEGFSEQRFEGRVARIGPQAASGSRTITIYIEIANPSATLKSGLFAQGTLSLGSHQVKALVPLTALHSESGVSFVYAINHDRIKRVAVVVGALSEADGMAEIVSGLDTGTRIVAVNLGPLKENALLKINAAPPPASPPAKVH